MPVTNGPLAEAVQGNIRAELARRNMTQAELGSKLGWRQDYVSRRLNGRAKLSIGELAAIAQALGCHVTDFLPDE